MSICVYLSLTCIFPYIIFFFIIHTAVFQRIKIINLIELESESDKPSTGDVNTGWTVNVERRQESVSDSEERDGIVWGRQRLVGRHFRRYLGHFVHLADVRHYRYKTLENCRHILTKMCLTWSALVQ